MLRWQVQLPFTWERGPHQVVFVLNPAHLQKVRQQRECVIKPEEFYTAVSPSLEMALGIKDSASNSPCHRHVIHYALHARTHWNSVQRERKTLLYSAEIRLFGKHKNLLSNNFSVESQVVSTCLVALVSLELGHSVEVPHSAFKPCHAQLRSQAGKGTEVSCRATVCGIWLWSWRAKGQSDSSWGQSPPLSCLHQQLGVKLEVNWHLKFLFMDRGRACVILCAQGIPFYGCTGYHTGQVTEFRLKAGENMAIVLAVKKHREISSRPEIELAEVKDSRCYGNWYSFLSFQQSWMFNWFTTESDREDAAGAEESFAREWQRQCIAFIYIGSFLKIRTGWGSRYKLFPSTKLCFWARWQQERGAQTGIFVLFVQVNQIIPILRPNLCWWMNFYFMCSDCAPEKTDESKNLIKNSY